MTDPRPMTPAESRALDALVEWRRAVARHAAALESDGTDHIDRADAADVAITCEDEMNAAADALVAEREVRRGA